MLHRITAFYQGYAELGFSSICPGFDWEFSWFCRSLTDKSQVASLTLIYSIITAYARL